MREKDRNKTGLRRVLQLCVLCVVYVLAIALVGADWELVAAEPTPADSWNKFREQAAQAFQKDDLQEAENLLLQALHEAEGLTKEGQVFVSLVELSWCELSAEKCASGIGNLRRALALSETNHGAESLEAGVCLAWLGEMQFRQKDSDTAKKL